MPSTETNRYKAEDALDGIIKSAQLAHAYLFLGPDKELMGKTAFKFVKAINCLKQQNGLNSCGECASCKKIDTFNHPDVGCIKTEGASHQIKIDQIRNLNKYAHLKPTEARKKAYIIYDADLMAQEAGNCLLKILEEPPEDVIIILISLHLGGVSPTIISRCQAIRFSDMQTELPLDEQKKFINEFLNAKDEFSSAELEFTKRPKEAQLKTIDLLLAHFRSALVNNFLKTGPEVSRQYAADDILNLMNGLLKSKELLQSNVSAKLVADYILDGIFALKTKGAKNYA